MDTRRFYRAVVCVAEWLSCGFASFVILAACLVPVALLHGMDLHDLSRDYSSAKALEVVTSLSVALGVSTFLAAYVLQGNWLAYSAAAFAAISPGALTNPTVFILAVVPPILGGIGGHYLNRYANFQAKRKEQTLLQSVSPRFVVLLICMLATVNLLEPGRWHWIVYIIWIAKLHIYLAGAAMKTWTRTAQRLAT